MSFRMDVITDHSHNLCISTR